MHCFTEPLDAYDSSVAFFLFVLVALARFPCIDVDRYDPTVCGWERIFDEQAFDFNLIHGSSRRQWYNATDDPPGIPRSGFPGRCLSACSCGIFGTG